MGDLNGDGNPDVVAANWCVAKGECAKGEVSVLLGNGDGSLTLAGTNLSAGKHTSAVATGDFNKDGRLDVVVANECTKGQGCRNGAISVLLGNGDGTLKPAVKYPLIGSFPKSVAVGDFNGDGNLDLAVAHCCLDMAGILLGNGDGTFQPEVSFAAGQGDCASSIATADFNRDGKLDLVVADPCQKFVSVLLGNGNGTFQPAVTYARGTVAIFIAVGDFNGDAKLDLAVAELGTFNVTILLGNGDGTFGTATAYPTGAFNPRSVAIGDFNEDGKLDLVVANDCQLSEPQVCGGNGTVSVLLGRGDGTFKLPVNYDSGGLDNGPNTIQQPIEPVVVGDLDGDGHADLAVANQCADSTCANGSIVVLRGNGDGTFDGQVVNNHYATSTALTSNPNPSMFGQAVTFAAVVTSAGPTPTGKVKFLDGAVGIGSATLNGSGTAKLTRSTLTVGTHPITARYLGDAFSAKSTSSVVNQVVQ
jgi:hypothetical protein